ncbi:MAG TPA: peptidylprolyl isomerase, partial [Syntrophorhabdaceae bacterium]|nr:peptidylprolyl isomerase [Syntrophorhabdaceae bacterium]
GMLAVICLFSFSCTKKESGKVLATIDKDKVTLEEFNKELDKIPVNMKMAVATESGKRSFLDNLIIKKLLLKEAAKNKIENEQEFQTRLLDIKTQLLIESLLRKRIASSPQLSDEEVKKYYEANKDKFKKEKEIGTRHILLKTEEEAKQIKDKLKNGEDFIELAKQYSMEPNARTSGGDIGFHPKGALLPEYEEAAFKLTKNGQVSGIVKTQYGYHIIRLEGTKPPSFVPLEEVKDFIKQQMAQEKQKELIEKYVEELKKNAKITVNETLLKDEKPASDKKAPDEEKAETQPSETPKDQKPTEQKPAQKK